MSPARPIIVATIFMMSVCVRVCVATRKGLDSKWHQETNDVFEHHAFLIWQGSSRTQGWLLLHHSFSYIKGDTECRRGRRTTTGQQFRTSFFVNFFKVNGHCETRAARLAWSLRDLFAYNVVKWNNNLRNSYNYSASESTSATKSTSCNPLASR